MILSPELMLAQIRDIAKSMPTGVVLTAGSSYAD